MLSSIESIEQAWFGLFNPFQTIGGLPIVASGSLNIIETPQFVPNQHIALYLLKSTVTEILLFMNLSEVLTSSLIIQKV